MKSGAGDDPFADDPFEEEENAEDPEANDAADDTAERVPGDRETTTPHDSGPPNDTRQGDDGEFEDDDLRGSETAVATDDERTGAESGDGDTTGGGPTNGDDSPDIPWVLRRSRVKEDRNNVHQFFLRDEYSKEEDDIVAAVAEELDIREKQLKKLDVREAMVATADVEAIAATLDEWGYEYVD